MSIRKRSWKTSNGEPREAWIVDYVDQAGGRHIKTFERKKDADNFSATTHVQVREGTHVPDHASITVREAGDLWIQSARDAGLEPTTIQGYEQHLRLHINPAIGALKLSRMSVPAVRSFEDRLRTKGCSPTMTKYVVRSLGGILADSQERGLIVRNPVRELRSRRRHKADGSDRRRAKLKIGVDIPTPSEIKAIVGAAKDRWRPLLLTAIFAGLRASELRGLRWADVDLKKAELCVRQRADRNKRMGLPKTSAGERTIPLPPIAVNTLRAWKLACPQTELDLCFPTTIRNRRGRPGGKIQDHANIVERGLKPTMIAAGVTAPMVDDNGKAVHYSDGRPALQAKYTGLHALRHFYASWCINRKADGGLELPAKVVQHRLGHSSITVTLDTYGHLFPRGDDGAELAEAERALLG